MSLDRLKQEWEEIAGLDPCWAILSEPDKKFGKWEVEEFFRSGEQDCDVVMKFADSSKYPAGRDAALDFGCGVGRVTRAFAKYFKESIGVDISEEMITRARDLNREILNCSFRVNSENKVRFFSDGHFDLVYTNLVLQHLPNNATVHSYISDFVRILKANGLLVFQLPNSLPLIVRLQPRRTLYKAMRGLGFTDTFLYKKLGLHPMRMRSIAKNEIIAFISSIGGKLLHVETHRDPVFQFESSIYYLTK